MLIHVLTQELAFPPMPHALKISKKTHPPTSIYKFRLSVISLHISSRGSTTQCTGRTEAILVTHSMSSHDSRSESAACSSLRMSRVLNGHGEPVLNGHLP